MTANIEEQVVVLKDIEKIKILKARYCYLADAAISGDLTKYDEFMGLFTEDARVEFVGFGVYQGKPAVSQFYREVVHSLWSYASHMVMNPVIEVNGSKASGIWRLHCVATTRKSNRAVWIQGNYAEEYVKTGGAWQWQSIVFKGDFYTPFDEGWVRTKMMSFE